MLQSTIRTFLKRLNDAIFLAKKRVAEADHYLEDIRSQAARLSDGTKAYKSQDGIRAFTDTGQRLTPEERDSLLCTPTSPSWEQRVQAAKIEEKTIQDLLQLDHFKDRLTRHETRLASNEPLSDQDMQDIRTHLKNLPDAVKTILACPPPAHTGPTMASEYTNSPFQNAPSMAKPFRTATTLTWNDTPIIFPWPKNLL